MNIEYDLGALYIECHCKDCKYIPHSLIFICIKFSMASNLIKSMDCKTQFMLLVFV